MWPPKSFTRRVIAEFTHPRKQKRFRQFHFGWIVLLLALAFGAMQFASLVRAWEFTRNKPAAERPTPSRLSKQVSVRAAGRGNPTINLSDGREVLTSYVGPPELQLALEQNSAEPLSLASADFDEDGVPDLVSGYGYQGRGIITILRGNVDSIYPNSPETQQRRAQGQFTDAPFLSPARVFEAPIVADFVGAGDFDGDGHWDVVVA